MKEWLKRKIDTIIYKIVTDEDKSINQKVWELSEYFNRYDWIEVRPEQFPFMKPEPRQIKDMIYECYRKEQWLQLNVFDSISNRIAEVVIEELEISLINT